MAWQCSSRGFFHYEQSPGRLAQVHAERPQIRHLKKSCVWTTNTTLPKPAKPFRVVYHVFCKAITKMKARERRMSTGDFVSCYACLELITTSLISFFLFLTDNLRYAFTSCVYNYPEPVTNVSTPCLVSCTPLGAALDFQLTDPVGNSLATFCGDSAFADNTVSTCEFCYSLTSQQAFLANCK